MIVMHQGDQTLVLASDGRETVLALDHQRHSDEIAPARPPTISLRPTRSINASWFSISTVG